MKVTKWPGTLSKEPKEYYTYFLSARNKGGGLFLSFCGATYFLKRNCWTIRFVYLNVKFRKDRKRFYENAKKVKYFWFLELYLIKYNSQQIKY